MNLTQLKKKLFRKPGQRMVIGIPYLWLLVLFLIPFAIVLKISFAEQEIAIPPFTPLTTYDEDFRRLNILLSFQNYADIFQNFWATLGQLLNPFSNSNGENIYLLTYWSSIKTALTTTIICLLIGYPTAYAISRANPSIRNGLLLAIMLPFWTSFLLRVYAWMGLLGHNGIINNFLMKNGHHQSAAGFVLQRVFAESGDGLRLPAVYDSAFVHAIGETRRPLARSRF